MSRKTIILGPILLFCTIGIAISGTITLPQTGQTNCYDIDGTLLPSCSGAGQGQDGDIRTGVAWPDPRFNVFGDCVNDNLTGLMWAKNANLPGGIRTWQEALNDVASINSGSGLCGYHDWHLPDLNELESLVHADQPDSAAWLNTQGFINVQDKGYWSSTSYAVNPIYAWEVIMKGGGQGQYPKGPNPHDYVWPVRSGQSPSPPAPLMETGQDTCYDTDGTVLPSCSGTGQDGEIRAGVAWPIPRFAVFGDCVNDNLTGLMWAKNANLPGGTRTWQEALNEVASINSGSGLCGYHDWHLPNRKELRSLNDYSQNAPALPLNRPFTQVQSTYYWSSTSSASSPDSAWIISMSNGEVPWSNKASGYCIWPVRLGQVYSFFLPLIMR
jgi:hypothetical protein